MKHSITRRITMAIVIVIAALFAAFPVLASGIEPGEGFSIYGLSYDEGGNMTQFFINSANNVIYKMSDEDGLLYETQEVPQFKFHGYTMTDEKYSVDFFISTADGSMYILGDNDALTPTDQQPQVSYDDVLSGNVPQPQEGGVSTDEFLDNSGYDKYEPEYYCFDPELGLAFYRDVDGVLYHINENNEYYVSDKTPSASAQYPEENSADKKAETVSENICNVKVLEVISDNTEEGEFGAVSRTQMLKVEVLDGEYKGRVMLMKYEMSNTMGDSSMTDPAQVGDKLIGYFAPDEETGEITGIVTDFARTEKLIWVAIIFVLLLLVLGGIKGMRSLAALVITCLACIFIMVPAILNGLNPIIAAILAGIVAISVTLIIVYGFTMKTVAAAVGAFSGVVVAGILTAIMSGVMHMTGIVDCDSIDLALINLKGLDLSDVLFATIIISALGGTIDVGISIASALDELKEKAPDIKGVELFKSGINIGVDIMGASLNTLILSYVGGSLTVLLIVTYYSSINNMTTLFNDEMIASELLQALVGSMGLLCTVPITSLVAARMMCAKGNFGKMTLDCFPPLKKCVTFVGDVFKKITGGVGNKETVKEPENLYEAAVKRSREMYESAEDTELEDDFDD